ncbi:hypothetical protein MATL_G00014780 [Megalops atlanticus]|uniref:DNA cross-link repair 1A protein n=1 Tax=Megalops atlanticus TaxID=7932 RepID=A0A9D3QGX3_MEGAT|nr:hypothetical protein MATL_G00014780 [Megalops atlanticus]
MSQHDSENDIWEYKSLRKIKKSNTHTSDKQNAKEHKTQKKPATGGRSEKKLNDQKCKQQPKNRKTRKAQNEDGDAGVGAPPELLPSAPLDPSPIKDSNQPASQNSQLGKSHTSTEEYCPSCQMPFSILLVQSPRWHVSECLDTLGKDREECPDSLKCSSTIPSHYRKYSHFQLAHSRATNEGLGLSLDSLQDSSSSVSAPLNISPSPSADQGGPARTPASTLSNALLLLKSPAPQDIKKKKGWSPIVKGRKTPSREQEGGASVSSAAETRQVKAEPSWPSPVPSPAGSHSSSSEISYSPLSAHPAGVEALRGEAAPTRRALTFDGAAGKEGSDDSVALYSDEDLSGDDLLDELLTQSESEDKGQGGSSSSQAQETSITSLAPCVDELNEDCADAAGSGGGEKGEALSQRLRSPQCEVLEQLRERLRSAGESSSWDVCSGSAKQHPAAQERSLSTTQTSAQKPPRAMAPRRPQASSGLKQTDIGVFFGLKPLQQKEAEVRSSAAKENPPQRPLAAGGDAGVQVNGGRRQRKRKAASRSSESEVLGAEGEGANPAPQEERRGRGGRRRWRKREEDGSEPPKRCPFYKKIPGTRFAVDAFQYGTIEGISAYFLTHFHSDHYSGLKKGFSQAIYCNRITGNLVKSKLRVEEQYIHILPMNTECTVEGVRVVLLDANHCPGAAMLLFLLPGGQTVLHTGDFRADPSMERCPELLGRRVHTLYLDTTYCSPEYSFPSQQEIITFAVNTAFECVALNPRTLVVCGTYAVGKEKVFLALAEVLGCRISMSRDKFNTMCCLESDRIRQLITTDWNAAQIHLLPMMQLNFRSLQAHLGKFSATYDQILAFRPTGWTFNRQAGGVEDLQPEVQGNISIYGIPYSEHSSYLEMKRFVQWLRPLKIIPTVNVGSWSSRKAMERIFSEWDAEARSGGTEKPAGRS